MNKDIPMIESQRDSNECLTNANLNVADDSRECKKTKKVKHIYSERCRLKWSEKHSWINFNENNPEQVFCVICKISISAHPSVIDKQDDSFSHNLKSGNFDKLGDDMRFKKMVLEINLVAMFVEQDSSFLSAEKMTKFLKKSIPDSETLQNVHLDRKKSAKISTNVIAPAYRNQLIEIARNQFFCIGINEMTDVTTKQSICIMMRYLDRKNGEYKESLLDLVPTYD
ncbi:hypothetical protein TKK_0012430 [Trichogramma kaykai]